MRDDDEGLLGLRAGGFRARCHNQPTGVASRGLVFSPSLSWPRFIVGYVCSGRGRSGGTQAAAGRGSARGWTPGCAPVALVATLVRHLRLLHLLPRRFAASRPEGGLITSLRMVLSSALPFVREKVGIKRECDVSDMYIERREVRND